MTQADLALAVTDALRAANSDTTRAVSQATVSRWESGVIDVTMHYEAALAAALEVSERELFQLPPDGWQIPPAMRDAA